MINIEEEKELRNAGGFPITGTLFILESGREISSYTALIRGVFKPVLKKSYKSIMLGLYTAPEKYIAINIDCGLTIRIMQIC